MVVLFYLVFGFISLVVLMAIAGMIAHMVMFGTLFGIVTNRIAAQIERDQNAAKAVEATACAYCHVTIPANEDQCPGCGAKRLTCLPKG